jgi:hypothetical protein
MFFSRQNRPKVKKLVKFMVIAVVIAFLLIVSGTNLSIVGDTKTRIVNQVSRAWLARVKVAFQVTIDRKAGQND